MVVPEVGENLHVLFRVDPGQPVHPGLVELTVTELQVAAAPVVGGAAEVLFVHERLDLHHLRLRRENDPHANVPALLEHGGRDFRRIDPDHENLAAGRAVHARPPVAGQHGGQEGQRGAACGSD